LTNILRHAKHSNLFQKIFYVETNLTKEEKERKMSVTIVASPFTPIFSAIFLSFFKKEKRKKRKEKEKEKERQNKAILYQVKGAFF
jgi:hypothetical protein